MWTDIISASAIIVFISLLFRFQQAKLTNLEGKKLDKDMFDQAHDTLKSDMKKGEDKFVEIAKVLQKHGETLARIDERTLKISKKNGVE